jgi:hypothetical protein
MIPPGFFGGYYFLFGAPFHYSPLAHIPLAEPHYGFTEDMYPIYSEYNNHKLWIIYNCMYSIVLPSTYGIFIVAVLLQMRSLGWTAAAAAGSVTGARYFCHKKIYFTTSQMVA